jgi:hypothetical protein
VHERHEPVERTSVPGGPRPQQRRDVWNSHREVRILQRGHHTYRRECWCSTVTGNTTEDNTGQQ